ncbi:UPF0175 family protein [Endozoicomonas acroporae]|uniref:UPF0175 family protein n=1 Tax=Endozoicomonas acroporae TaxID=1701104 RepID=UPI003D7BDC83
MVGVPFTEYLLEQGVGINFAIHLFKNQIVTLTKAARIAYKPLAEFIQILGVMGVDVVDYDPDELERD